MFGLRLTVPRWLGERLGHTQTASGVDPMVFRALTLLSRDGAASNTDDKVSEKLVQEELASAAWIDGGHWLESASRDAAKVARRLHNVSTTGDE